MSFSAADHAFMAGALRLAARGLCSTSPNPRVGCVLVREGVVVGSGWHEKAGEPHAEVHALRAAGENARGSTAYVSLEPCAHFGRTPPCADALAAAGVVRVVAAMRDPNPLVAGGGFEKLRAAGVAVEHGLLEAEARELNIGFVSRMTRGRPWLRIKVAASIDGKTALMNGKSQWITSGEARRDAHAWRARSCAMLTGIGTVRADNPRLTVREIETARQPLRVVVDSRLSIAEDAAILEGGNCLMVCAITEVEKMARLAARGVETLILPGADGRVDLPGLLAELGRRGLNEVTVEAGAVLNGAWLRTGCADELLIYQAPLLVGDQARGMADLGELTDLGAAYGLKVVDRRMLGQDLRILARLSA